MHGVGPLLGAIEAGGTKFVCGLGTGPDDLETVQFPTGAPEPTLATAANFFRQRGGARLAAVGIASFGPLDLDPGSPTCGFITSTPKPEWSHCDIAGTIRRAVGVRAALDTDVNGAALAEARWGAARGVSDFLYLTVGTGIGGGAVANGRIIHGRSHPEMGHIRVPHDLLRDAFPGSCPYHGDCLEGLASGPAMEQRWGIPAHQLPEGHPAWELEAHYLALGIANWTLTLSPRRVILGGGVMQQSHLFELIHGELTGILNGYVEAPEVTAPCLGNRAGVLGALVLAEVARYE